MPSEVAAAFVPLYLIHQAGNSDRPILDRMVALAELYKEGSSAAADGENCLYSVFAMFSDAFKASQRTRHSQCPPYKRSKLTMMLPRVTLRCPAMISNRWQQTEHTVRLPIQSQPATE